MQAAVQRYIDSSVSKTINLPADISFEAFKDVYQQAYDLGCKGCTTFRPNEITGAVLSVGARETLAESADTELVPADRAIARTGDVVYMTDPLARPDVLPGRSYKLRWPESDHAIYITLNDIVQEGAGKEPQIGRKSVAAGKSGSVGVDSGGRRIIKKTTSNRLCTST